MSDPIVKISYGVRLSDRGDCWTGLIEPIGVTVYGDSPQDAVARADNMMEFITGTFHKRFTIEDFRSYLKAHNMEHETLQTPGMRVEREMVSQGV